VSSTVLDQVAGELALGEQGIGGDGIQGMKSVTLGRSDHPPSDRLVLGYGGAHGLRPTRFTRTISKIHENEEFVWSQDRLVRLRKICNIACEQIVGGYSLSTEKLNRVFEVSDVRVDGLIQDLLVRRNAFEDITHENECFPCHVSIPCPANNIEDIVEADRRDKAFADSSFAHGPDTCGRRVEGITLRNYVEQQIGVDKKSHSIEP